MARSSKKKNSKKLTFGRVIGRFFAFVGVTLLALLLAVVGCCFVICKGPSKTARDKFVHTITETENLQFIPSLFLTEQEIADILESNTITEPDTNKTDL